MADDLEAADHTPLAEAAAFVPPGAVRLAKWSNSRVLEWLLANELTQFLHVFASQGVSGALLLEYAKDPTQIDDLFAPGHTAEPVSPTPTQIFALKSAVKNLRSVGRGGDCRRPPSP